IAISSEIMWDAHGTLSTRRCRPSCTTCGGPSVASGSVLGSDTLPSRRALRSARRVAGWFIVAVIAVAITPHLAHAWTPGTPVFLGEAVMRSLAVLPPAVAALLREFPYDFLYGSIAADTSIAKKYAPAGRHCHSWTVGMEIFDGARDEPLRAFG